MVNPPLLEWAREESGYALEQVAKRLGTKPERVRAWEKGEVRPSVRQVQELSKFYHRPFGIFFLQERPKLPPLSAEYRRLPGVRQGEETPEFRLALRLMSLRRAQALELSEEIDAEFPEFALEIHLQEPVTEAGDRLRRALAVDPARQSAWRDDWQAWREWRAAVESLGVLVFQFPKVRLTEARGLALLDFPLPAIGINSKEFAPAARAFTLMHELAHIGLAKSREEAVALRESRDEASWAEVERFAEAVASAVLIPQDVLESLLPVSRSIRWDIEAVRGLARRFRVTSLAMATRLRIHGAMSREAYWEWKAEWDAYVGTLSPPRGGFANPVDRTVNRAGLPFVRLVVEALDQNRLNALDASRMLELGFHHFDRLRESLRAGPGDTSAADAGD